MDIKSLGGMFGSMEAFLQDTDIEVEVSVGSEPVEAEEVVAETAEAADTAAEATEAVEETEAAAEQTEMVLANYDELANMLAVAKSEGVNRTFLALCNRNDVLAKMCRISLPSCESFDAVGTPHSAESQAVIAGLESALGTFWDMIIRTATRIKNFVLRIFDKIRTLFTSSQRNIGRLREALNGIDDGAKPGKDSKIKMINISNADGTLAQAITTAVNAINSANTKEDVEKAKEALSKADSDAKAEDVDLTAKAKSDVNKALETAVNIVKDINKYQQSSKTVIKEAEDCLANAKRNRTMKEASGTDAAVKAAKEDIAVANKKSALYAKVIKCEQRRLSSCIKFAAAWIRAVKYASPKKEEQKA